MRSYLMLGFPGSGKTTFLAALWHLIEGEEVQTQLRMRALQPDREYLNRVRNAWLSVDEVGRTSLRVAQQVTLELEDRETLETTEISVPDLSGEIYRMQWTDRRASPSFADLARGCCGLFIFVHSEVFHKSRVLRPGLQPGPKAQDSVGLEPIDWSPELANTQVQLVDTLQFIEYLRPIGKPLPTAVIVSAWDRVHGFRPDAWLSRRMPLLHQFVSARSEDFPSKVYGISAQGGDLVEDRDMLLAMNSPANRIRVVEATDEEHHDLTSPIRFLMRASAGE